MFEKQRHTQTKGHLSVGAFLIWLQQPGLIQAEARSLEPCPGFPRGCRGSRTRSALHCSSRHVSRDAESQMEQLGIKPASAWDAHAIDRSVVSSTMAPVSVFLFFFFFAFVCKDALSLISSYIAGGIYQRINYGWKLKVNLQYLKMLSIWASTVL